MPYVILHLLDIVRAWIVILIEALAWVRELREPGSPLLFAVVAYGSHEVFGLGTLLLLPETDFTFFFIFLISYGKLLDLHMPLIILVKNFMDYFHYVPIFVIYKYCIVSLQ